MSTVTQLKFKNGHTYPVISVIADEGRPNIQGQYRKCIDVQFPLDQFDAVKTDALIDGNLDNVTVTEDGTDVKTGKPYHKEWIYNHFNIIQHIGIDSYTIGAETDTSPEVTENRTSLLLAQLTYLEVQQAEQATRSAELTQAIAELSVFVAGGAK